MKCDNCDQEVKGNEVFRNLKGVYCSMACAYMEQEGLKMDKEHRDEIIREEVAEAKDEAYQQWKQDNIRDLLDEFADCQEDAFDEFCRTAYKDQVD